MIRQHIHVGRRTALVPAKNALPDALILDNIECASQPRPIWLSVGIPPASSVSRQSAATASASSRGSSSTHEVTFFFACSISGCTLVAELFGENLREHFTTAGMITRQSQTRREQACLKVDRSDTPDAYHCRLANGVRHASTVWRPHLRRLMPPPHDERTVEDIVSATAVCNHIVKPQGLMHHEPGKTVRLRRTDRP